VFDRSILQVGGYFDRVGLGRLFRSVRGIRAVRQESFHDVRTLTIGLNPRDVRRPFAAFHRRAYLLIHELGHHFVETRLGKRDRKRLEPLFGNYDAPYRRAPKPRRCGPDYVSRYAMTHPAEDIAETFAVCLWCDWQPGAVRKLLGARSPICRRKAAAIGRLIARERRRDAARLRTRTASPPRRCSRR
ncbi:MAG: putative zinc-binding metallopeptidase, partial [Spirochaetes bacterium]|nr:putative zinc-binding metallopeptidase [Spirochaetota bacterium]